MMRIFPNGIHIQQQQRVKSLLIRIQLKIIKMFCVMLSLVVVVVVDTTLNKTCFLYDDDDDEEEKKIIKQTNRQTIWIIIIILVGCISGFRSFVLFSFSPGQVQKIPDEFDSLDETKHTQQIRSDKIIFVQSSSLFLVVLNDHTCM